MTIRKRCNEGSCANGRKCLEHLRFDVMWCGTRYRRPANDFAIPRMEQGNNARSSRWKRPATGSACSSARSSGTRSKPHTDANGRRERRPGFGEERRSLARSSRQSIIASWRSRRSAGFITSTTGRRPDTPLANPIHQPQLPPAETLDGRQPALLMTARDDLI